MKNETKGQIEIKIKMEPDPITVIDHSALMTSLRAYFPWIAESLVTSNGFIESKELTQVNQLGPKIALDQSLGLHFGQNCFLRSPQILQFKATMLVVHEIKVPIWSSGFLVDSNLLDRNKLTHNLQVSLQHRGGLKLHPHL